MTAIARPLPVWPAKGTFGPFLHSVAPSAVLAALLVRFSSLIAPGLGIQVSSWGLALAYLYFMLCRATYVYGYVAMRASADAGQAATEAERAFGIALGRNRHRSLTAAAVLLVVCAVADIALRRVGTHGRDAIEGFIVWTGILVWLVAAPGLLLSWASWVRDGAFSPGHGFALIARHPSRMLLPWITFVLTVALASFSAFPFIYSPLRSLIAHTIPSGEALFLFGVAFLACVITGQVWSQAVFATWMREDVERVARSMARPLDRSMPLTATQQRLSRFGVTSGRTTVRSGSATDSSLAELGPRFLGLTILVCAGWMFTVALRDNPAVAQIGSTMKLREAVAFLALVGLLFILTPTLRRRVRVWRSRMRAEAPPPPPAPVHPRKFAKLIALMIAGTATFVTFPALVPYAKVVLVVSAITLAVVRWCRAD